MLFYYREQKIKKELILMSAKKCFSWAYATRQQGYVLNHVRFAGEVEQVEAFAGIMLGDLGVKAQHGVTCILKERRSFRGQGDLRLMLGQQVLLAHIRLQHQVNLPMHFQGWVVVGLPQGGQRVDEVADFRCFATEFGAAVLSQEHGQTIQVLVPDGHLVLPIEGLDLAPCPVQLVLLVANAGHHIGANQES